MIIFAQANMKTGQVLLLDEIDKAAADFLKANSGYRTFAFFGEMGAGKTTFIKSLCKLLGVSENVTSPTFSLVNEYKDANGNPVFHFDFYRIEKEQEAIDIGVKEYFNSGHYCFVEWSEKILHLLPEDALKVHITVTNQNRIITTQNV